MVLPRVALELHELDEVGLGHLLVEVDLEPEGHALDVDALACAEGDLLARGG